MDNKNQGSRVEQRGCRSQRQGMGPGAWGRGRNTGGRLAAQEQSPHDNPKASAGTGNLPTQAGLNAASERPRFPGCCSWRLRPRAGPEKGRRNRSVNPDVKLRGSGGTHSTKLTHPPRSPPHRTGPNTVTGAKRLRTPEDAAPGLAPGWQDGLRLTEP